ncbi:hypothetical protein [Saccharibacillus alkalitolerans]|uniref:DUF1963 domain-containing protein n=1 Tax=Saccharibacillus alkalitolerans TaxID=2705290 RepID=A0ABX0F7L1_9BACL|nr:hypothetical protein [Saccharibacillus alkalitolerans]NGZ76951.1 hypothetical protein [Saccharibacillus alkalitolerans]
MIDKTSLSAVREKIGRGGYPLPFIADFEIRELHHPRWEASAYFVGLNRRGLSEQDALLLLLERLEYAEREWEWSEEKAREARSAVLPRLLYYVTENGDFAPYGRTDIEERIAGLKLDELELTREIGEGERVLAIYDDWNLLQIFGRNEERDYVFLWETLA